MTSPKIMQCNLCHGNIYANGKDYYYCAECGVIYRPGQDAPEDEVTETD